MAKNKRGYTKYEGLERKMQQSLAQYLDTLGVLWFHPPNERKVPVHIGALLKRQGVKSGVPDIVIMEARIHDDKMYHGFALEIKKKGGTVSENQKIWLERLKENGWASRWTDSLDEAIFLIDSYLSGNKAEKDNGHSGGK